MKRAEEIRVPQRMPQVSRLAVVLDWARVVKEVRRAVGRKSVRRGVPFSVYAAGWNW